MLMLRMTTIGCHALSLNGTISLINLNSVDQSLRMLTLTSLLLMLDPSAKTAILTVGLALDLLPVNAKLVELT